MAINFTTYKGSLETALKVMMTEDLRVQAESMADGDAKTATLVQLAALEAKVEALAQAFSDALEVVVNSAKVSVPIDITAQLAAKFTAAAVAPTDGGAVLKTNMAATLPAGWGTAEKDGDAIS